VALAAREGRKRRREKAVKGGGQEPSSVEWKERALKAERALK